MAQLSLQSYGGLVASIRPQDLPDGASPRTWDTDYITGRVLQRAGQQNVYSYAGGDVANLPGLAIDISDPPSVPWENPDGIKGDATYASVELGSASATLSPSFIQSSGEGTPWLNPLEATATGIGSNITATIINFSITGGVVTFTTPLQNNPFVAGQTVTISEMITGTYLNGQTLTVLPTGLSSTSFEANFTHADVASTQDAGFATPDTTFTSANVGPAYPYTPAGQYSIYAYPVAGSQVLRRGTCFGSFFAPWSFYSDSTGSGGCNGCPLGAGGVATTNSPVIVPQLPAGAVVQNMYPVAKGTGMEPVGNAGLSVMAPGYSEPWNFTLNGTFQQGPSIGNDLAALSGVSFTFTASNSLNEPPGTNATFSCSAFNAVVVLYTVPAGIDPIPPDQLQTLQSTFSFAVPNVPIRGIEVDLASGTLSGGDTASLQAQLTLNGVPVGTPKAITSSEWATNSTLGGSDDTWGISNLTGARSQ